MELKRSIGGQADGQSARQEFRQRVAVVFEEKEVIASWWHGYANLAEIIKVLKDGRL